MFGENTSENRGGFWGKCFGALHVVKHVVKHVGNLLDYAVGIDQVGGKRG